MQEFSTYIEQFMELDDLYPSTKWKYDVVTGIGFHINKQYTRGCQVKRVNNIYKRVLKTPDNKKDNLCFWRCLAIQLYKDQHTSILTANSRLQRVETMKLLKYTQAVFLKNKQQIQLSDDGQVGLSHIPHIAQTLQLNIQV